MAVGGPSKEGLGWVEKASELTGERHTSPKLLTASVGWNEVGKVSKAASQISLVQALWNLRLDCFLKEQIQVILYRIQDSSIL